MKQRPDQGKEHGDMYNISEFSFI